ncbi:MAG TPA: phosphohydrolase [Clostridiales bacterium]|nr:phosphohydrolase [Clostridiales bacterium]
MNEQEIIRKLKQLLPEKRFRHTIGVAEAAQQMAERLNADTRKVRIAALLHDCSRYMTGEEMVVFLSSRSMDMDELSVVSGTSLLHASVSAVLAKEEYGIDDPDILSAVECHTLGKKDMNLMDKIIFVSDYIEPGRDFEGVEALRNLVITDLDQAVIQSVNSTVRHLLNENRLIHPKLLDIRNGILYEKTIKTISD